MSLKATVSVIELSASMMWAKYDAVLQHMRQHDAGIKDLKRRQTVLSTASPR